MRGCGSIPIPRAQPLREKLARLHGCQPENIIVGNGSDELLALAVRASWSQQDRLPPVRAATPALRSASPRPVLHPSYSLYPVLAEIHGAAANAVPLDPDFTLPSLAELRRGRQWDFRAALTLVTTPNAPSGRGYRTAQLDALCRAQKGVVLLDEAYVDFAQRERPDARAEIPARAGRADVLQGLFALLPARRLLASATRSSSPRCTRSATATTSTAWARSPRWRRWTTCPTTGRTSGRSSPRASSLSRELDALGFQVFPSQTNFILVRPPKFPAQDWLQKLRDRKLLVRWFSDPSVRDYLRITIGTPEEAAALVKAAKCSCKPPRLCLLAPAAPHAPSQSRQPTGLGNLFNPAKLPGRFRPAPARLASAEPAVGVALRLSSARVPLVFRSYSASYSA